jgi:hypothetical protein
MDQTVWLQLGDACRRSRRTQNQLYRLAALGRVRTRIGARGRVEFNAEDLDRLAAHEPTESQPLRKRARPGSRA